MILIINEMTRNEIISKSKTKTSLGRFTSRLQVKDVSIDRLGLLEIQYLDQPDLEIFFDVGEYRVVVSLLNFMNNLRKDYQRNYETIRKSKTVDQAIRQLTENAFNRAMTKGDIKINCSCPDFRYRYSYVATTKNYKYGDPENRPAVRTNPKNQGSACKHIIRVLNRPSEWSAKVITGVTRMIRRDPRLLDRKVGGSRG